MGAVRGDVVDAVCRELGKAGDPDRAKGRQAYLKSTMPCRGISAPQLRATLRPLLADPAYLLTGRDEWETTIRGLWDGAQFREERYAALAISGHRLYRHWASREETDQQLLLDCIMPNLADQEFFIRKAIGWSLCQYAHSGTSAADWVRCRVEELGPRLSPLSRREALKHLG
jgi:3-methyladenine DNA glycosylase AlkD